MGRRTLGARHGRSAIVGIALSSLAAILAATLSANANAAGPTLALQASFAGVPGTGASEGAYLGYSVAVSETTVAVGAINDAGGNGAVYVYVQNGSTWSLQQELTASDGTSEDQFGYAVALSGNELLVGAAGRDSGRGAVYVFSRSGSAWTQGQELTASDAANGDCFGCAVAINGTTAIAGAPDRLGATGGAYIFTQTSNWQLTQELAGANAGDQFGFSVALSPDGTTAVAGAYGASSQSGEVYVFTKSGATWASPSQVVLTAGGGQASNGFGYSVSSGNGELLVGTRENASSSPGAAYVFTGSGASWSQQQPPLAPSDGVRGDLFGYSVALSGNNAVIGAYEKASTTGAVYGFVNTSGTWAQTEANPPGPGQSFGYSVAVNGSIVAVGAISATNFAGALYIYGLSSGSSGPPPPGAPALGARTNVLLLALSLAFAGAVARRRVRGRA